MMVVVVIIVTVIIYSEQNKLHIHCTNMVRLPVCKATKYSNVLLHLSEIELVSYCNVTK